MQTPFDPPRIDIDEQPDTAIKSDRLRLGAAHLSKTGGQHELSGKIAPSMLTCQRAKRFIRALQDALRADVYPTPGGHLAVHHQAFTLVFVELLLRRPMRDDVCIRNEDSRRVRVRSEHPDRLARLDHQRFVFVQLTETAQNGVKTLPISRRLASAAVNDQIVRVERHIRIKIILYHPIRGLNQPVFAG